MRIGKCHICLKEIKKSDVWVNEEKIIHIKRHTNCMSNEEIQEFKVLEGEIKRNVEEELK